MKLMKIRMRRGDEYSFQDMSDAIDFALDKRISYIIHAARTDGSPLWNFFSPDNEEDIIHVRGNLDRIGCKIVGERDLRGKDKETSGRV